MKKSIGIKLFLMGAHPQFFLPVTGVDSHKKEELGWKGMKKRFFLVIGHPNRYK